MHPGLVGGLVGGAVGVAGGIIGTVASIRSTHGPRERSFMVRASLVFWGIGILYVFLLLYLKTPLKWLLCLPYSLVFLLIPYGNRKLRQLRELDTAERQECPPPES